MKIPMDVTISTGANEFQDLDFYYGAKALEGTSEVVALVAHTILNETLTKQVPSIEGIRANLRKSFVGSHGQKFELEIFGSEQLRVFRYIGKEGFFQIMEYYIGLATGVSSEITKDSAIRWERSYIKDDVDLIKRIREPLLRIHKPIENQGYKVKINRGKKTVSEFNEKTLEYIAHEVQDTKSIIIEAVITRFNSLTGTGRLLTDENLPSVSFSPKNQWKTFQFKQRKIFSKNLDRNNASEEFLPIRLEVLKVTGTQNTIKHYRVIRVVLEENEK